MSRQFPKIHLHKGKERSVLLYHPWVFSGAINQQPEDLNEGDIVEVYSSGGQFLGTGHFHAGTITVRLFSFEKTDAGDEFWKNKIMAAHAYRKNSGLAGSASTNVYRLVHAEGDGMPGLIIDIYKSTAVIQAHTIGMWRQRLQIASAIKNVYGTEIHTVYDKSHESLKKQNQQGITNEFLFGDAGTADFEVTENNLKLIVDVVGGQKTGFFIDQRENRKLLASYCHGKKVLNTFCYSGGFSVYALAAGASQVHSVDSSRKAIDETNTNVALNFPSAHHESFAVDVFDFFKKNPQDYDVIVLDPPAFAKHKSAVRNAITGYRNLNYEALKRLSAGGMLFTFSCSQAVDRDLFRKIVFQAAAQTGKTVRIVHQLTQPPDHPISIYHPEGEYLKGLVLYIE